MGESLTEGNPRSSPSPSGCRGCSGLVSSTISTRNERPGTCLLFVEPSCAASALFASSPSPHSAFPLSFCVPFHPTLISLTSTLCSSSAPALRKTHPILAIPIRPPCFHPATQSPSTRPPIYPTSKLSTFYDYYNNYSLSAFAFLFSLVFPSNQLLAAHWQRRLLS